MAGRINAHLLQNEPGEGTGVSRSFYAALTEALMSSQPLRLPSTLSSSQSASSAPTGGGHRPLQTARRSGGPPGQAEHHRASATLRQFFSAAEQQRGGGRLQSAPSSHSDLLAFDLLQSAMTAAATAPCEC